MKKESLKEIKMKEAGSIVDQQIMEAGVRLRGLQRKYKVIIEREVRALRYSKSRNRENPKAVANIKNAYYSLTIVNQAQERLREITSIQELCKAMNEMGAVLKLMNKVSGNTEKVNKRELNKGIRGMDKAADRNEGNMQNYFNAPLDSLVNDEIIENLLNGQTPEECMDEQERDWMEDVLVLGDEFLEGLDGDTDLEQSMADIDDLIRNL